MQRGTSAYAEADAVLVRTLYLFSIIAANIYFSWLAVLPVLNAVTADLYTHDSDRVDTTTISETFGSFNVVATVLIITPMSVIFVLRVHRTLCLAELSERARRGLFLCLLAVQYSMFVVLRYDAIKGNVHYAFTGLTFVLLYTYHFATSFRSVLGTSLFQCKVLLGAISSLCIFCFLGFILVWQVEEVRGIPWTATCLCEITGAIALASLDIVDIYTLRTRYHPWRRDTMWSSGALTPTLEYRRTLECCVYYGMAAALVLFGGWVLWMPLLAVLDPLATHSGLSLPTTVSQTFQDFGTLSTIYLVGPLSVMYMAHMYRIAFAGHLSSRARRALQCGLVLAQLNLFVVIRFDAIRGTLHYVATGVVFFCAFVYHLCISHGPVVQRKYPLMVLSFALLAFFVAVFFAFPSHDSWWWGAACFCEILAILLLLALDVVDIIDDSVAHRRRQTRTVAQYMQHKGGPQSTQKHPTSPPSPPPGPRAPTRGDVLHFPDRELVRRADLYRNSTPVLLRHDADTAHEHKGVSVPQHPPHDTTQRTPSFERLFVKQERSTPQPKRVSFWEQEPRGRGVFDPESVEMAPYTRTSFWDDAARAQDPPTRGLFWDDAARAQDPPKRESSRDDAARAQDPPARESSRDDAARAEDPPTRGLFWGDAARAQSADPPTRARDPTLADPPTRVQDKNTHTHKHRYTSIHRHMSSTGPYTHHAYEEQPTSVAHAHDFSGKRRCANAGQESSLNFLQQARRVVENLGDDAGYMENRDARHR